MPRPPPRRLCVATLADRMSGHASGPEGREGSGSVLFAGIRGEADPVAEGPHVLRAQDRAVRRHRARLAPRWNRAHLQPRMARMSRPEERLMGPDAADGSPRAGRR
ncbi:MAG: hypothetical protein NVS2B6_13560 [Thermoleophilaceae bacterium]